MYIIHTNQRRKEFSNIFHPLHKYLIRCQGGPVCSLSIQMNNCCLQVPSEAQKKPWRLWQRMRDFEKPLNDNKRPTRPLQANSGHCGIVVYTYREVQAVLGV